MDAPPRPLLFLAKYQRRIKTTKPALGRKIQPLGCDVTLISAGLRIMEQYVTGLFDILPTSGAGLLQAVTFAVHLQDLEVVSPIRFTPKLPSSASVGSGCRTGRIPDNLYYRIISNTRFCFVEFPRFF